jgi:hypothetical protein
VSIATSAELIRSSGQTSPNNRTPKSPYPRQRGSCGVGRFQPGGGQANLLGAPVISISRVGDKSVALQSCGNDFAACALGCVWGAPGFATLTGPADPHGFGFGCRRLVTLFRF